MLVPVTPPPMITTSAVSAIDPPRPITSSIFRGVVVLSPGRRVAGMSGRTRGNVCSRRSLGPTTEPAWVNPGGSARRPGVGAPRESGVGGAGGYDASPTNLTRSLPFRVSGVMVQVPLQVDPAILPAVFGPAIGKATALLSAPRMQKLAFTGA